MLAAIVTVASWGDGSRDITAAQTKRLFLQLPYRFEVRHATVPEGAKEVLARKATTARGTFVNFKVTLRSTGSTFGFTDDAEVRRKHHQWHVPARFHTRRQWREAMEMVTAMEEKLCRATLGKPCPV